MQRRTRVEAAVAPLPAHPSRLKSRAAALVTGTQDFRKLYDDEDDPAEGNDVRVKHTSASYSDELLTAFKRKTQQLCDETREQYEQKIERQEVQHERQVQALQRQLREVVGSCVSLAEHEQILATTAKEQQRQLEEIRRLHRSQAHEMEQRCDEKWQAKVAGVKKQRDQDKAALMQRIEQLELQKNDATAEVKEHELSELRWSEKLEAAARAKEAVEQRVEDAKKRLDQACRIIVALKTRLRHHARLARDLESQRDKTVETRDEVMQCKLAYAELKGDLDTRAAGLEREMEHAQRALADERANSCALQSEVAGLREQLQRQQCSNVELTAKTTLGSEHHAADRKKLRREIEALRAALQAEKQAVQSATARLDKTQQRAAEAQLQHQTLVQGLRTRLELQQTAEVALKRQTQRLHRREQQLKAAVERLHAENKRLEQELHGRDASTEAWAKKLFGQRQ